MKAVFALTTALAAAATASKLSAVSLDNAEIDLLQQELHDWKATFGREAEQRGLLPPQSNTESLDNTDEIQRFLDSKLAIEQAARLNPSATFGLNVFSLLKPAEFAALVQVSFGNETFVRSESAAIESTEAVPREVDWSNDKCNPPVKSQGQCGSCWAFSTLGATEFAHCLATGDLLDLSEQQVVSCSKTSYGCDGGFPPRSLDWIRGGTENVWPYTAGSDGKTGECTKQCEKKPLAIRSTVTVSGDAAITTALAKQTVTVVVEAGNTVWQHYTSGVITQCPGAQSDHAVIAVGYTDEYIKIKNSWGTSWGEQGYIRLQRGAGGKGMCNVVESASYSTLAVAPKPSTSQPVTAAPTTSTAAPTTDAPTTFIPATTTAPTTTAPRTPKPLPSSATPTPLPSSATPAPSSSKPTLAPSTPLATWERCGGKDFPPNKVCGPNDTCKYHSDWYSQCVPKKL